MSDEPQYSIVRIANEQTVRRMNFQNHTVTTGIVEMVFGSVPDTLQEGGDLNEEWKLNLRDGNWLIVKRTA